MADEPRITPRTSPEPQVQSPQQTADVRDVDGGQGQAGDAHQADEEQADPTLSQEPTVNQPEETDRPTTGDIATEETEPATEGFATEIPEQSAAGSMPSPMDAQPIRVDASRVSLCFLKLTLLPNFLYLTVYHYLF